MPDQLANVYPQFEVAAETKNFMAQLNLQYEIDFPATSLLANAYLQYELAISPLDDKARLANLFLHYEVKPLSQNMVFGPQLASET